MEDLKARLIKETGELLSEEEVDLVEIVIRGNPKNPLIQFFVDRKQGITVNGCAQLSRKISNILDSMENDDLKLYRLEVSSPGLDRPLRTVRDFQKHIGKEVIITMREDDQFRKLEGTIIKIHGDIVVLENHNRRESVDLSSILKAIIKLKW